MRLTNSEILLHFRAPFGMRFFVLNHVTVGFHKSCVLNLGNIHGHCVTTSFLKLRKEKRQSPPYVVALIIQLVTYQNCEVWGERLSGFLYINRLCCCTQIVDSSAFVTSESRLVVEVQPQSTQISMLI